MFPSYSDTDFAEFKAPNLEQKKYKKRQHTDNKGHPMHVITQEDISLIYKWHSNIVRNLTSTEWFSRNAKIPCADYALPIMQKYPIFSAVIKNAWEALDADFEGKISPTLMLIISKIKSIVDGNGKYCNIIYVTFYIFMITINVKLNNVI